MVRFIRLFNYIHLFSYYFFFTAPPTPDIYTLSLHDALPIWQFARVPAHTPCRSTSDRDLLRHPHRQGSLRMLHAHDRDPRSEEHTSELQSPMYLVCRLLLEKKKYHRPTAKKPTTSTTPPFTG